MKRLALAALLCLCAPAAYAQTAADPINVGSTTLWPDSTPTPGFTCYTAPGPWNGVAGLTIAGTAYGGGWTVVTPYYSYVDAWTGIQWSGDGVNWSAQALNRNVAPPTFSFYWNVIQPPSPSGPPYTNDTYLYYRLVSSHGALSGTYRIRFPMWP